MRVGLDTRPLSNQSAARGIGMYTSHLKRYLQMLPHVTVVDLKKRQRVKQKFDILHYPYFDLFYSTLPWIHEAPAVVTVHDVIPLLFAHKYPVGMKGKLHFKLQKLRLKQVAMIVTDSKASKKDIIDYMEIPEDKVRVVYLAPQDGIETTNPQRVHMTKMKFELPKEYILYVGDVNPNKNIPALMRACGKNKITLVIVGRQAAEKDVPIHPETKDVHWLHEQAHKYGNVRMLGFVANDDLAAIYQGARAYCQPSLSEGFGLPVLEAMKCGCPVIATNVGSLPEVGGDAAIYTQPTVEGLAEAIKQVREYPDSKRILVLKAGREQVKKFSWEKTARETLEVYEEVLGR